MQDTLSLQGLMEKHGVSAPVSEPVQAPPSQQATPGEWVKKASLKANPKTAADAWRELWENPLTPVPYAGQAAETFQTGRLLVDAEAMKAGKATEEQSQRVVEYLRDASRDKTFGYHFWSILHRLPATLGEFFVTKGAYTVSQKAAVKASQKLLGEAAEKGLKAAAIKGVGMLGGSAAVAAAIPTMVAANTLQEALPEMQLTEDEAGRAAVVFGESTDSFIEWIEALSRGYLRAWIETFSERTGGALVRVQPFKAIQALQGRIVSKIATATGREFGEVLEQLAKAASWQGAFPEFTEERFSNVLSAVLLGDELSLSPEQAFAELAAFTLPGAASVAAQATLGGKQDLRVPSGVDVSGKQDLRMPPGAAEQPVEPRAGQNDVPRGTGQTPDGTQEVPTGTPEVPDRPTVPVDAAQIPGWQDFTGGAAARVVAPTTAEDKYAEEMVGRRGAQLALVEFPEGNPTGNTAAYAKGFVLLDANSTERERQIGVLSHELAHHLRATDAETFESLASFLRGEDPRGVATARAFREKLGEQGGVLEEEAIATYVQALPNFLKAAKENPEALRQLIAREDSRTLVQRLLDGLRAVAAKLGLPVDSPALARLKEAEAALGALTGAEAAQSPARMAKIAQQITDALDTLTTADWPKRAPLEEQFPAKPDADRMKPDSGPAAESSVSDASAAVSSETDVSPESGEPGPVRRPGPQTPAQRRRAEKRARKAAGEAKALREAPAQNATEAREQLSQAREIEAGIPKPVPATPARRQPAETRAERAARLYEEGDENVTKFAKGDSKSLRERGGLDNLQFLAVGDAVGREYQETILAYAPGGDGEYGRLVVTHAPDGLYVLNVEVPKQHRRQGVARALYRELVRRNPGQEIQTLGGRTPDGDAMRQALEREGVIPLRAARLYDEGEDNATKFAKAPPTDSEAFKAWFGDSPIINDDGSPELFFHATKQVVTQFRPRASAADRLLFFTRDPDWAVEWATRSDESRWREGRSEKDFDRGPQLKDFYGVPGETQEQAQSRWYKAWSEWKATAIDEAKQDVNVLPVYVAPQRPFDPRKDFARMEPWLRQQRGLSSAIDRGYHKVGSWLVYERPGAVEELTRLGYDAIWIQETSDGPHDTLAVWEPGLVKSATGNVGTYDASNPDIRFAKPTQGELWDSYGSPTLSQMDRARRRLQDLFLPLKRTQEHLKKLGRKISEPEDVYESETVWAGRVNTRAERMERKWAKPMVQAMAAGKIELEDAGLYLYARHAPTANKVAAERNPQAFGSEESPGSGMRTSVANKIVADAESGPAAEHYKKIAELFDAMNAERLQYQVDTGLISEEKRDAWIETFGTSWAPLRSNKKSGRSLSIGSGFDIRGPEARRRGGRKSMAENPLLFALEDYERAIVRGEKNRVDQSLHALVSNNPDPKVWAIRLGPEKGTIEDEQREALQKPEFEKLAENEVSVKIQGQQYIMSFADPSIPRAMRKMNVEHAGKALQTLSGFMRWLSAVNTSFDPGFVVSNFLRDLQTAGLNLGADGKKEMVAEVVRRTPKAINGIRKVLRSGDTEGEWAPWYQEFQEEGGSPGWFHLENIEKRAASLSTLLANAKGERKVQRALRSLADFVADYNSAVELGVRLSSYRSLRERGVSKQKAAAYAKELTVNFNRKGELGTWLNSFYLFYNAGIQGSARMVRAITSPTGRKIALGIAGLGLTMDMLARAMADDDEETGENEYDQIPEYVKARNMVIMLPGGKHLTIPMPYGYSFFHSLGRALGEVAPREMGGGGKQVTEVAPALAEAAWDSFVPIGGEKSLLQRISPTVLDPLVQVAENKDWTGSPLKPFDFPGDMRPESQRYFSSVSPAAREVSAFLNRMSGGDKAEPGAIDVSPEVLEHWYEFIAGGLGRQANRFVTLFEQGEATPLAKVPILRRVLSETPEWYVGGRYRELADEVRRAEHAVKVAREDKDTETARRKQQEYRDLLSLSGFLKATERRLKKLREREDKEAMQKLQARFIRRFHEVTTP